MCRVQTISRKDLQSTCWLRLSLEEKPAHQSMGGILRDYTPGSPADLAGEMR
jgi:hypothetical protein